MTTSENYAQAAVDAIQRANLPRHLWPWQWYQRRVKRTMSRSHYLAAAQVYATLAQAAAVQS